MEGERRARRGSSPFPRPPLGCGARSGVREAQPGAGAERVERCCVGLCGCRSAGRAGGRALPGRGAELRSAVPAGGLRPAEQRARTLRPSPPAPCEGGGAACPMPASPRGLSRSCKGRSALCKHLGALMGTWPRASFCLNGHKLGSCGWMLLRVLVTALAGQIFGCFLGYNHWTSAGGAGGGTCALPVGLGCGILLSGSMSSCGRTRFLLVGFGS